MVKQREINHKGVKEEKGGKTKDSFKSSVIFYYLVQKTVKHIKQSRRSGKDFFSLLALRQFFKLP